MLNPSGNGGMAGIIGLGILFAIPSVAGSIKEALKAKPMVQAGPSAVIGPVGGAVGQGMQVAYQLSMIKGLIPQRSAGQISGLENLTPPLRIIVSFPLPIPL